MRVLKCVFLNRPERRQWLSESCESTIRNAHRLNQRFTFGIGVGIGIESLRVTAAFHSLAKAKGPAEAFDNRAANIKSLGSEIHIAPFDSESDSDAEPDRIPLRQQLFGKGINLTVGGRCRSPYLRRSFPQT